MLFVALCVAPSMANAHAGHAASPTLALSMVVHSAQVDFRVDVKSKDVRVSLTFVSELRSDSAAQQSGCDGVLCCCNAPCAACAFVIVGDPSIVLPPRAGAKPFWAASVPGSGIGPQDLSRPPRFFV